VVSPALQRGERSNQRSVSPVGAAQRPSLPPRRRSCDCPGKFLGKRSERCPVPLVAQCFFQFPTRLDNLRHEQEAVRTIVRRGSTREPLAKLHRDCKKCQGTTSVVPTTQSIEVLSNWPRRSFRRIELTPMSFPKGGGRYDGVSPSERKQILIPGDQVIGLCR